MGKKQKKNKENRSLQMIFKSNSFQYVEAYKMLRTNLNFITCTTDTKVMAVTSAIPKEGKTNVIINLAITLAESGEKVLVVDADMRKPMLHKYLKIPHKKQGLSNVLSGTMELNSVIVKLNLEGLSIYVLPCGPIPPNPTELLGSNRMEEIVETVRDNFDYVLIDTPPASIVTDVLALGNLIDGVLLVVRQKFATIDTVKGAQKNLEAVGVKILGVIFNAFEVKKTNKGQAYYESYQYSYER